MAKALRVQFEGAIYHVMNRGIDRRLLFRQSRDYECGTGADLGK